MNIADPTLATAAFSLLKDCHSQPMFQQDHLLFFQEKPAQPGLSLICQLLHGESMQVNLLCTAILKYGD